MSPHSTSWLWCAMVVLAGPTHNPVKSIAARTPAPPKTPATIEAQAKFFQDFFSVQLSPYKIEFGHVCEDPNTWEQRYERKDYKNHRDMGKVRWGDKQGGYGEHYWDLNHAGHDNNHGNDDYGRDSDDGSYNVHEHDNEDSYDEPSDRSPNYSNDHYDPETASYEETNRAKRHPKTNSNDHYDPETTSFKETNTAKRHPKTIPEENIEDYGDVKKIKPRPRKHKDRNAAATTPIVVEDVEEDTPVKNYSYQENKKSKGKYRPAPKEFNIEDDQESKKSKGKYRPALKEFNFEDDDDVNANTETEQVATKATSETQNHYAPQLRSEPTRYVPYEAGAGVRKYNANTETEHVAAKATSETQNHYAPQLRSEPARYVPYEAGAGVRQYIPPDVTPAASVPRLFLEPSTGHVVDRATGQAYILQPIVASNNDNNYNVN